MSTPSGEVTSAARLGPVGLGTAPLGNLYRQVTDAAAHAALETAWAGGLFIGVVVMGLVTGATSWRWG